MILALLIIWMILWAVLGAMYETSLPEEKRIEHAEKLKEDAAAFAVGAVVGAEVVARQVMKDQD